MTREQILAWIEEIGIPLTDWEIEFLVDICQRQG